MLFISATDPIWADADNTSILCNAVLGSDDGTETYAPVTFKAVKDADGICGEVFSAVSAVPGIGTYIPPPAVIPFSVSRRQFKLGLLSLGLLTSVESFVAANPDPELQIDWADALDFERQNTFIINLGASMGKTPTEIDDLFILAGTK